ncbi:hypothetical protein GCM10010528_10990 [Gordonia defluvii]|jgi:hypothetical protein|uniref:PE domain-containing protein n=1 Tax=Gordonia defluvii TaxID=283718 RepID=A0ABP6L6H3_9ACTN|nr:PE domain-containing protein [Gordonia sp. UBA5067]
MTSNLRANPDGLAGVGAALNRIADRLAHIVDEATVRTPLAAGNDEVSRRVAAKLVCAASDIEADLTGGARALREFAAIVQAQADALSAADATALTPLE